MSKLADNQMCKTTLKKVLTKNRKRETVGRFHLTCRFFSVMMWQKAILLRTNNSRRFQLYPNTLSLCTLGKPCRFLIGRGIKRREKK